MLTVGYKASAEQFGPRELLDLALQAERVGFDSVAVSDHFQPFRHTGGHSPAAFPWLGALAATAQRVRIGTSVTTPTLRLHPTVVAQSFATLACLAADRVFMGVGTGESLNEVPATGMEWPGFGERLGRLREAVELMRRLFREDRVSFEGRWYRTRNATLYDRPERPVPILVAGAGKRSARFAGEEGDGFITTSGKAPELYADDLLPSLAEGARAAGREADALERMLEVKVSYDPDLQKAYDDCAFWGVLALPGELKQGVDDPLELERRAEENHANAHTRFIVTNDPEEVLERVRPYLDLGFRHLVFHSPAADQASFLDRFGRDVVPRLRDLAG